MIVDFLIDKCVLGTNKHLFVPDKGAPSMVDTVPQDVWHLSGELKNNSSRCLDTLLRLEGYPAVTTPPTKYAAAMSVLMSGSTIWPPPWKHVMTSDDFKAFLKTLVERTVEALNKLNDQYYVNTYVASNEVFGALQRARVDIEAWRFAVAQNPKLTMVKSFAPLNDGFAAPVVYDRFGTRTGRLTVASGPSMLTLRKDLRNQIILPSEPGHKLFMLDYSALEMRILLYESGFRCDHPDMYTDIQQKYLPDVERNVVKGAVIAGSYGLKKFVWGKQLGIFGKELDRIEETLQSQFKPEQLLRRLKQAFIKDGFIRDHFGKKLIIDDIQDHMLLNTYAQATGANVALLGFKALLPTFVKRKAIPLFLLHDAIIVSAPEKAFKEGEILKVSTPGYVQKFLLKVSGL